MTLRKVLARRWYRIDKDIVLTEIVTHGKVAENAAAFYDNAADIIATGRFQTPYAVFSVGAQLTDKEREVTS